MGFGYTGIRNERQWKATTGLSQTKFLKLSKAFGQAYESIFECSFQERQANSSQEAIFRSYEDLLFFTLFSLKSGLGYDALGAIFDCDGSTAKANQAFALPIPKVALTQLGLMPKRSFSSVEEFEAYFAGHYTLLVDGTEQQIQRSKDNSVQKVHFSGKKNYTAKMLVISSVAKIILYISRSYVGSAHDFGILKQEFPSEKSWSSRF